MQKKIILQLFLFLTIIVISIVFFKTYFFKEQNISIKESQTENQTFSGKTSNIMHDIKYEYVDREGNGYIITSELGQLNNDKPNFVLMENVSAIINLKNSAPITISSDKATYNSLNYDTNFVENVLVIFSEHTIASDNFDLFFNDSEAIISNNVVYKNLDTLMKADKIKFDLITKNSTIFMDNDLKKVKIININ